MYYLCILLSNSRNCSHGHDDRRGALPLLLLLLKMIIIKRKCFVKSSVRLFPVESEAEGVNGLVLFSRLAVDFRFWGFVQSLLSSDNILPKRVLSIVNDRAVKTSRCYLRSPRCRNGVRDILTALHSLWPTFMSKSLGLTGTGVTLLASRLGFNPSDASQFISYASNNVWTRVVSVL